MPVSPARKIAFEILRRADAEGAYASDLLHTELSKRVRQEDAALATELTLGVLRWRRRLDFILEQYLERPSERLDREVFLARRMGLYQIRFLQKIPARAAVNESAELVKAARKRSAASLVNAVLRRCAESRREDIEALLPAALPLAERLGILHSHPTWMVERWLGRFGEARTIALLESNNRSPRVCCCFKNAESRDETVQLLRDAGLDVTPGRLLASAAIVSGGSPAQTAAFQSGKISIQDEASQMVPLLLDVRAGETVLDVCAAPGGKAAILARAAGPRGCVIACDRHAHRLRALGRQMQRLGLSQVNAVELDAEQPLPFTKKFPRILVDAPCSGTGTLARHPEIRWRLSLEDFEDLHGRQTSILKSALAHLSPAGRLVYATCSLEPEENESVAAEALAEFPALRRVPGAELRELLRPHLAAGVEADSLCDAEGIFRTSPPQHHSDGFFAVAFEMRGT